MSHDRVAIVRADSYDAGTMTGACARLFSLLGYDPGNPLGGLVKPGDRVFIKPNWVAHEYRRSCARQDSLYSTITHPSLIRSTTDQVATALDGRGAILIGDNPSIDADFARLRQTAQLDDLPGRYQVPVEILDLRPWVCADLRDYGNKDRMKSQPGDPAGTTVINLGRDSLFAGLRPHLFRGVYTDRRETMAHHTGARQEYAYSSSIVEADVYVSLPKLKTHHKVGTTLNLKGLVGTIANKNLLIHWRVGWPGIGGDEYAGFLDWARGLFTRVKKRGAWDGNDSAWRMVVDIYRGFNRLGRRRTFSIVDGVVAGEGNGPFCPVAKAAQVLIAGEDLLRVDIVATRLMGFDPQKVPYLAHLMAEERISTDQIQVISNDFDTRHFFHPTQRHLSFVPPTGWGSLVPEQEPERHVQPEP